VFENKLPRVYQDCPYFNFWFFLKLQSIPMSSDD
jgi:hypothetical protein